MEKLNWQKSKNNPKKIFAQDNYSWTIELESNGLYQLIGSLHGDAFFFNKLSSAKKVAELIEFG